MHNTQNHVYTIVIYTIFSLTSCFIIHKYNDSHVHIVTCTIIHMNAIRIYLQIINSWGINKIKQNGMDQCWKSEHSLGPDCTKNWSYMWVSMHQSTHGHYYRSESLYMIVNFVSPREHNMVVHILKLAKFIQFNLVDA